MLWPDFCISLYKSGHNSNKCAFMAYIGKNGLNGKLHTLVKQNIFFNDDCGHVGLLYAVERKDKQTFQFLLQFAKVDAQIPFKSFGLVLGSDHAYLQQSKQPATVPAHQVVSFGIVKSNSTEFMKLLPLHFRKGYGALNMIVAFKKSNLEMIKLLEEAGNSF